VAATYSGGAKKLYINGELAGESTTTMPPNTAQVLRIGAGATEGDGNYFFVGKLAARVRAEQPNPVDGARSEATWVSLSWRAGDFAVSHDVYMSDSFDDVNDRAAAAFQGNHAVPSLVAGFFGYPFPDGLVPGTTYYWRVDEINDADPNSPWEGDVWSFWVPPKIAHEPNPADGAGYVALDAELSWTPGLGGQLHTVYFGDNFDDVNNAADGTAQSDLTYAPGTLDMDKTYYWRVDEYEAPITHTGDVWSFTTMPDIPIVDANLVGWWTFDEGQGAVALDWSGHGNHGTLNGDPQWVGGYDGNALEFNGRSTVLPGTGPALSGTTDFSVCAWIRKSATSAGVIIQQRNGGYNGEYRFMVNGSGQLDLMVYGDGDYQYTFSTATTVNDGNWHHATAVRQGSNGYIYVDGSLAASDSGTVRNLDSTIQVGIGADIRDSINYFNGVIDDVRLYDKALTVLDIKQAMRGNPLRSWDPSPADNSTSDVVRAVPVSWSPGDSASQHAVYFGTDRDAVAGADTSDTTGVFRGLQAGTSYTPPEGVEWAGGPYYWRVDEHNTDDTVTKGNTWKFSMADYILVDDFESYNDIPAGEPGSNLVYVTWADGFDDPAVNGSTMGYVTGESLESSNVHGGSKSVPFQYNNATAGVSEVVRTFTPAQDWTAHGVTTLSLWFFGDPANVPGQLYVKINGVQVNYDGDSADLSRPLWQVWNIDLASVGTNLSAVGSLAIGVQGPGATGTLLLDDIRLFRSVPELPEEIYLEAEAAVSVTPPMTISSDPLASGGGYIGTQDGVTGDEMDAAPADGVATYSFTVQGGTYKIFGRVIIPSGDSFWVRVPGATDLTPGEDPDQPGTGWVRWADPPDGDSWHWADVFSNDHGDQIAHWTLPAGTYTLEIARREDGALLDAILITSDLN
jgi:hypothetical protein